MADIGHHRILVVDDDESIVESLRAALTQRGYEVIVARDGAEGLSRAERDSPDLIILDLVMPRRSGLTVLDHLARSRAPMPRIIMLTAQDGESHQNYSSQRGVDAFLHKPVDVSEFVDRVDELLKS